MARLTVLGIGNVLMRDEGVGVLLLESVKVARDWPEGIEFVDGGAGGLNLLNVIERANSLVVFDAAEMGLGPGEFRIIGPEQVRDDAPAGRLSMHDVPFIETLKLCRQFARAPERIVLLAVQPKAVEFGRGLSPQLTAAFEKLLTAAAELVAQTAAETKPAV